MSNRAALFRAIEQGRAVVGRDRRSIRFDMGAGVTRAYLSIDPLHYGAGNTNEIDTTWAADVGAWQWKLMNNNFQIHARSVLNAGSIVEWLDTQSGETVTLQPLALNWVDNVTQSRQQLALPQAVAATAGDNVLTWVNGYGAGRHFRYTAHPEKLVKEFVIDTLANLPNPTVANPYLEIEFILSRSNGVTLYVNGQAWDNSTRTTTASSIEFRLSNGTVAWKFEHPVATDSSAGEASVCPGIFELRRQGANRYCTVRFPKSWVDAAVFPIFIDPTLTAESSTGDGRVRGSGANDYPLARNTSDLYNTTATDIAIGQQDNVPTDGKFYVSRGYLKFDTSSIPDTATINQVNLRMVCTQDQSDTEFDLQIVKYDWSGQDPLSDANREAAYDGALAAARDDAIWRNSLDISINTQYTSGNLATAWINKAGTTYYALQSSLDYAGTEPTGLEILRIAMADHATASYRPTLIVDYSTDVTGTLSKTLGAMTSSTAGTVDVTGAFSKTLGLTTQSATQVTITASLEKTLGALLMASAGSVSVTSAANVILGNLLSSGAAQVDISGLLGVTLGILSPSGAGSVDITGSLLKTLNALISATSGEVSITGSLLQTLGALVLTAAGTIGNEITGSLAATLGNVVVTSSGNVDVSGIIGLVFSGATSSGSGLVAISSDLSKQLGALSLDADSNVTITGTLNQVLAAILLVSAGSIPSTEYSQGGLVSVRLRRVYKADDDTYTAEIRRNYKA